MATDFAKKTMPSEDKRWKRVNNTMRQHGYRPQALIETMHTVQELFGYVDDQAFRYIASNLHVPLSKVYGVATFYHFFNLKPQGEHTCVLCTGTACYIKGIPQILEAIDDEFDLRPGETTSDNKVSLMTARCVGACGLAPVVVFDDDVAGFMTPEKVVERIKAWRAS